MSAKRSSIGVMTAIVVGAYLALSSTGAQAQLVLERQLSTLEPIGKEVSFPVGESSTGDTIESEPIHANTADYATEADHAEQADHATEADHATQADHATEADHADRADHASRADHATEADHADRADHARTADEAQTLSPDTCSEGEILRKDVEGWTCVPMTSAGGAVLYAQKAGAATGGPYYAFGRQSHASPEAVAMVLPRDGLLRNLFILPDASRYQPHIATVATVVVNGVETELSVTHDSTRDGVNSMSNGDVHVFVHAGDTLAFLVEDGGSSCLDEASCAMPYTIAVSLD